MASRPSASRPRSSTGPRGATGKAGPAGPAGPAGHTLSKVDVLAMVADQFAEVHRELAIQLTRIAQIQLQVDEIHRAVKTLLEQEQERS